MSPERVFAFAAIDCAIVKHGTSSVRANYVAYSDRQAVNDCDVWRHTWPVIAMLREPLFELGVLLTVRATGWSLGDASAQLIGSDEVDESVNHLRLQVAL